MYQRTSDRPARRLALGLLAFATLPVALPGCSKGGSMNQPDGGTCRRLTDPEPGMMGSDPLPNALYAELRHADGTTLKVNLDGAGGLYQGETMRAFQKCDPPGTYYLERTVLVDAIGHPVGVAQRVGSSYQMLFQDGTSTLYSSSGFTRYYASFSPTAGTALPTVQSLGVSGATVRQGDRVNITSAVTAPADECGIRDATWWLTTSPGSKASPLSQVVIKEGSGSASLRVSPDLPAANYALEGQITTKSGRVIQVLRRLVGDTTYSIYNPNLGTYVTTSVPVAKFDVTTNASADRTAPQAVSVDVMPRSLMRCGTVSLSLKLKDDQMLPGTQQVKLRLGPMDSPGLVTATLQGSGDTLTGSFLVPMDAPGGFWVGYPESIQDAAGNIGTASLSGSKFTISGPGISSPAQIEAAVFYVSAPGETAPDDGGTVDMLQSTLDLRPTLPVSLININVVPPSPMPDQKVTVTVSWMDNGNGGLK